MRMRKNPYKKLTLISGGYLIHQLYSMLYPCTRATLKKKEHYISRSVLHLDFGKL